MFSYALISIQISFQLRKTRKIKEPNEKGSVKDVICYCVDRIPLDLAQLISIKYFVKHHVLAFNFASNKSIAYFLTKISNYGYFFNKDLSKFNSANKYIEQHSLNTFYIYKKNK